MGSEALITASCVVILLVSIITLVIVISGRKKDAAVLSTHDAQNLMREIQKLNLFASKQEDAIGKISNQISEQAVRIEDIDKHVISRQEDMNKVVADQMKALNERFAQFETHNEEKLEALRRNMTTTMSSIQETVDKKLDSIRAENTTKLDEIRITVDEKLQNTLQKRVSDSFKTVSEQLERVYKGLGDMQHLATDVGGLKRVLSGVKTRGVLGEIQLKAILEEVLAPQQYEANAAPVPGDQRRVEFAVKLPGDGEPVLLPIDSKFPADTYMNLQNAQLEGDAGAVANARNLLEKELRKSAKDISTKYINPPVTTSFAIMFLPFEGLYAEVANQGWVEILQREYHVNVAGPSTMAAFLNALQMGFKTLAIQKRSNEVWKILGEVKKEFGKFGDVMGKMQKHLDQTSKDLDQLIRTRTNAINRKLRDVEQLEEFEDGDKSFLLENGTR